SAYVAGETTSGDFPAIQSLQSAGGGDDAFLTKLTPSGSSIAYSTVLGGAGHDSAQAIALHSSAVYLAGISMSPDFPVTFGARQTALQGRSDAVVLKIVEGTSIPKFSTVQAASLKAGGSAAAESIVSGFGTSLATGTESATTIPLPEKLAG